MASGESFSSDKFSGIPEVPPDLIRAYQSLPEVTDEQFKQLEKENPHLGRELFIRAHLGMKSMESVESFVNGALFVYGVLKLQKECEILEAIFQPTMADDVGDEDPQPSI
jgi:hypothetical protein